MSLLIGANRFKPYVHIIENDDYWTGQMKHIMWLEQHNEDCDSRYTSLDMEPHD